MRIVDAHPVHTHGFVGMKREKAWSLIDELAAHATQERFVYYAPRRGRLPAGRAPDHATHDRVPELTALSQPTNQGARE